MKRLMACVVAVLILIGASLQSDGANFDLVAVGPDVLTDEQYVELNDRAKDIREKYQCEVSIAVMKDMGEGDIVDFARYLYDNNDYGYGEDKSGLMLFINRKERDYALISRGYGDEAFTEKSRDVLIDDVLLPYLGVDEYYEGFSKFLTIAEEHLALARAGTPFGATSQALGIKEGDNGLKPSDSSVWGKRAVVIVLPLIIATVVVSLLRGQLKSAVLKSEARDYMACEGLSLTYEEDRFSHSTETRTEIKSASNDNSPSSPQGRSGKF